MYATIECKDRRLEHVASYRLEVIKVKEGWATPNLILRWNEDEVVDGVVECKTRAGSVYRLVLGSLAEG